MKVVIGFDKGSSVTKLAAVDSDGTVVGTRKAENADPRPPEALVAEFAATLGLAPARVEAVVLTGAGAPRIEGTLAGVPVRTVSEFLATARGGLDLSGRDRAVVASLGTGTAFVRTDADGVCHLGGSGVGGGTLMGLCRRLYGLETFEQVVAAARDGDLDRIDLRIKDIADAAYLSLPPDLTSCNFGKSLPGATDADMILGFINMVLETITVMAVLACRGSGIPCAVLTGSLTRLPQAVPLFALFQSVFDVEFVIPEGAAFATAIGAAKL